MDRGEVLHKISTLPGHSGSPILWVQDSKLEKLTIVGIHKGDIITQLNGSLVQINAGKLLTEEVMVELREEAVKMGAEKFLIEVKQCPTDMQMNNKDLILKI